MQIIDWIVAACCVVLASLLTGLVRRFALASGILDVPNARSSHTKVTPRGGGIAIVLTSLLGFLLIWIRGDADWRLFVPLIVGGAAVAIAGYLDDRSPLPARVRIVAHFGAAILAVWCMGGVPELQFGSRLVDAGWIGHVLGVFGIVWVINLFNFMDGIDGIAGAEAAFVTLAGGLLMAEAGQSAIAPAALVVAGSCIGFLFWNWPPARIFMGDVGSGYLGLVLAVLALGAARENAAAIWGWLILGGVFFTDATVTLVRRLLRREKVYEAHRSHAYQWLARRWGAHWPVTTMCLAINVLWLLPLAVAALRNATLAAVIAACALLPLLVLALFAGAGKKEANLP